MKFEKQIATGFSENEGRVKGRLELFRKFICFGGATRPLIKLLQIRFENNLALI